MSPAELIQTVLQNTTLWGQDLSQLPGFADAVTAYLMQLLETGALTTLSTQFAHYEPVTN